MNEMLEKFKEDFEEALYWARCYYDLEKYDKNSRHVNQAKDFAYIAYRFNLIDYDKYFEYLRRTDKYDLSR